MPDEQRNPLQEFQDAHIPGAFFSLMLMTYQTKPQISHTCCHRRKLLQLLFLPFLPLALEIKMELLFMMEREVCSDKLEFKWNCCGNSKWDKRVDFIETMDILNEHVRLKAGILVHVESSSNGECCVWTAGKSCSWWKDSNTCSSSRKSLKTSFAPNMNKSYRACDDCFTQLKKALESGSVLRMPKARSSNILRKRHNGS